MNIEFTWSALDASYKLHFDFNKWEWKDVNVLIGAIKQTIPSSDREYDPDTKTWFIADKHFKFLDGMFQPLADNGRNVNYKKYEKPAEQVATAKFVSLDSVISTFEKLTSVNIKSLDFNAAKKVYFRAAMKLHPDVNPNGAEDMTRLNECWDKIKVSHYKQGANATP